MYRTRKEVGSTPAQRPFVARFAEKARQVARILLMRCAMTVRKPIFWTGLLVGIGFAFPAAYNMARIAGRLGTLVQVFEPAIVLGSDYMQCMPLFLGLLVMLSDAPFIDGNMVLVGMRVSRAVYAVSQLAYIAACCLFYYLFIALFGALICMGRGFIGNIWSAVPIEITKNFWYYDEYRLYFSNLLFLQRLTPYQALGVTLFFQCGYGFVLTTLQFLLNQRHHRAVGVGVALTVHAIGFLIIRGAMEVAPRWSLLLHALPAVHNLNGMNPRFASLGESALVFTALSVALCLACILRARKADYYVPGTDR